MEPNPQLPQIATKIGTKPYFLSQQQQNLDQWSDQASSIFRYTGQILKTEYSIKAQEVLNSYTGDYEDNYARCKKQFDAYCILNRKVQKKEDEIENLANYWSEKNKRRVFFDGWKAYSDRCKKLRRMEEQAGQDYKNNLLKGILKQWMGQTMESNKTKIKNQVLQKTQMQVSRIQTEYERLIKSLQQTLEKKLMQLKKEEQEHKLLHDKYEAMYSRAPANS